MFINQQNELIIRMESHDKNEIEQIDINQPENNENDIILSSKNESPKISQFLKKKARRK